MVYAIRRIPFNKPCIEGNEIENILKAVSLGKLSGDGHFSRLCEKELERATRAKKVLLTNSGTGALELAALLCDIQPGDEIIMPSFTFVSTANAFCLRGGRPVFVDISPTDLNIDATRIEEAMTERTRAIVPVHYAGISCDMDSINALARQHDLYVVEDAAHGLMSTYNGQHLGTIGDFGCFSFHETKTFISGEGGAITINSEEHVEPAEIMREKGTNRNKFFRGEVDKYTWVSLGSSFLPSELAAAFLYGQLVETEKIISKRRAIFERYERLLRPLVERGLIEVSTIPDHCATNYHMYYILVKNLQTRAGLIDFLRQAGVLAVFHYVPLHLSSYAREIGVDVKLPVTEELADRLIRLPFFNCIEEGEQEYVVEHIFHFFKVAPVGMNHATTSSGVSPQKNWSGDESTKAENAGSVPGGSPVRSR